MSKRSALHNTFVIERDLPFAPARVYHAFASHEAKARWFAGPDDWTKNAPHLMDFREGGEESVSGGPPGGPVSHFKARYVDIVPGERIVYTYQMHLNDDRISVSVATLEFRPAGKGTHLVLTEQGVYLDGWDKPHDREHGTRELLDNLERALQREAAPA